MDIVAVQNQAEKLWVGWVVWEMHLVGSEVVGKQFVALVAEVVVLEVKLCLAEEGMYSSVLAALLSVVQSLLDWQMGTQLGQAYQEGLVDIKVMLVVEAWVVVPVVVGMVACEIVVCFHQLQPFSLKHLFHLV